ncbi:unnamed protein product [Ilex paraguariensis]|uniref:Aldehyde dehydrogenase domain-containing protein n=1 Tax=Ilex paraguariensis TaxID=185542 RepID=A0ABC8SRZ8_9AQUA
MAIPIPSRQLFIDGEWREPVKKNRIPIINPATEQIIGDIPAATAEDVEIAVEAAQKAFSWNGGRDWSSATGAYRAKYLRAIAAKDMTAMTVQVVDGLTIVWLMLPAPCLGGGGSAAVLMMNTAVVLCCYSMGGGGDNIDVKVVMVAVAMREKLYSQNLKQLIVEKPLEEAAWDIDDVAGCFEYNADLAEALDSKQNVPISLPTETFKSRVLREPIGVVGLITPWYELLLSISWSMKSNNTYNLCKFSLARIKSSQSFLKFLV